MSHWRSVRAKQVLSALLRIGWEVAWQKGSRRRLKRAGWPDYTFAFHDNEEVGPLPDRQKDWTAARRFVASTAPLTPTGTRCPPSPVAASPDSSFPERCRRAGGRA